jgi:hypothetical protein
MVDLETTLGMFTLITTTGLTITNLSAYVLTKLISYDLNKSPKEISERSKKALKDAYDLKKINKSKYYFIKTTTYAGMNLASHEIYPAWRRKQSNIFK